MKIIIIGAVAAGTSAAAKARRNSEDAEIIIYEKEKYISYSGCGMPYFLGDEIESIDSLVPRDPKFFKKKYNIDVHIGFEVIKIDSVNKLITVKKLESGETFQDNYDKLVISTGASPFKPSIKGIEKENVFFLRNILDVLNIKNYVNLNKPKKALIAGTGFIGFEVLESLIHLGIETQVVEISNKLTPVLDEDMSNLLENNLKSMGINIIKSTSITEILDNKVALSNGNLLETDMIIMATGVRPNVSLAKDAGIILGETGAIKVDDYMQTNIKDIYSCGDCIETFSAITNKAVYRPLGSTANKTGRIAGENLSGGNLKYKGNLGSGIFKFFDITVAATGLSEKNAIEEGYDVEVCHNIKSNKPEYLGGKEMVIKAIADKKSKRILGVQIIGSEGVDKRIDLFATLITYKATVEELFHLDLAYAPPFSTTKDPVHYTGMILDNAINSNRKIITNDKISKLNEEIQIIDARSIEDYTKKGCVEGAINIPHQNLRDNCKELDKNKTTITYCNKGVTGNAAQNILILNGFKNVYNLSGGHKFYKDSKKFDK